MTKATEYDIFVSYASEDREWVRQLVDLLREVGVTVWYDELILKLGDSLTKTIDSGLLVCRYGVVVLSHSFFGKHWPEQELAGLAQREVGGNYVILPIMHNVNPDDVRRYSPRLADRVAARSDAGHFAVTRQIVTVARPDLVNDLTSLEAVPFDRIRQGPDIVRMIRGAAISVLYNDDPIDTGDAEFIGVFLQELRDLGDIWNDLEVADHVTLEHRLTGRIREIEERGWTLFAHRSRRRIDSDDIQGVHTIADIAAVRETPRHVARVAGHLVVVRPDDQVSSKPDQ
ncbi:MAG: toll/interleukin-1 receptor domain-containing protein [Geminicoccales bacterium]